MTTSFGRREGRTMETLYEGEEGGGGRGGHVSRVAGGYVRGWEQ